MTFNIFSNFPTQQRSLLSFSFDLNIWHWHLTFRKFSNTFHLKPSQSSYKIMEQIWNQHSSGGLLAVCQPLSSSSTHATGSSTPSPHSSTTNRSNIWSPFLLTAISNSGTSDPGRELQPMKSQNNYTCSIRDIDRKYRGQSQQSLLKCPVCMVTLDPSEVDEHFYKEVQQLEAYRNGLR